MKKDRKWLWLILGAVVVLFVGFQVWRFINRDVVVIKTATVVRGPIKEIISASGYVDAPLYELDSKVGGRIASLMVREGDRVVKGQLLAELDNTARLVSPGNGVVAKINYLEGETVVPGTAAIIVVNYSRSWIDAQIDEVDIADVKIGDLVTVTSDIYTDRSYSGEVTWIAPLAELRRVGGRIKMDEESYVFPCKVKLLNSYAELKVNMQVNIDISAKENPNALVIPREALFSKDDSSWVYLVKKNRVSEQKVGLGIRSFSSVEVVSGVAENDLVVITNISKLKNKGRVKIDNK